MNTKQQSLIGVGRAITYYTDKGYSVFVPVVDCNRYDLLVDTGEEILRVEVKTSTQKDGAVGLRTLGGNQSWNGEVKRLSKKDCDRVYLVQLYHNAEKEFDISELEGRSSVRVK